MMWVISRQHSSDVCDENSMRPRSRQQGEAVFPNAKYNGFSVELSLLDQHIGHDGDHDEAGGENSSLGKS
jgi:hypothetical protein